MNKRKKMFLTCPECGTKRNEPFCPVCVKPTLLDAREKRERQEAIDKYVESIGGYTYRDVVVYSSKTRNNLRVERQRCLPESHRGPTKWAHGSFRFRPGWDAGLGGNKPSNAQALLNVDNGVLPPNLDPFYTLEDDE